MFKFRKIKIAAVLILLLIQVITPPPASAGPGDNIRIATTNSHLSAQGLAKRLVARRLFMASERFLSAQAQQVGYLQQLNGSNEESSLDILAREITVFGIASPETTDSLKKFSEQKVKEYLALYDRATLFLAKTQDVSANSLMMTNQMRQFARYFKSICLIGESELVPGSILPELKTPVPEFRVDTTSMFSTAGQYQGTILATNVATPGTSADIPGMAATLTTAGLLATNITASVLMASGIGAGVGVAIAATTYVVAMQQAIDDASDISSAQINHFLNGATAKDVSRYYRDECQSLEMNFDRFLEISMLFDSDQKKAAEKAKEVIDSGELKFNNFKHAFVEIAELRQKYATEAEVNLKVPLDSQDKVKVSLFQSKMATSSDFKHLANSLNDVSSADLSTIITSLMLQLQLNNNQIRSVLEHVGFSVFQKLKAQGFIKVTNIIYRTYIQSINVKYGAAIQAVKQDLQVASGLETIRGQLDFQIAQAILRTASNKSVSEVRDNIVRIQAETSRLLAQVKQTQGRVDIINFIKSIDEVLKLLR
jgi:phosphoribosylcarboxyaminoimidazole (NCAIR) mutase